MNTPETCAFMLYDSIMTLFIRHSSLDLVLLLHFFFRVAYLKKNNNHGKTPRNVKSEQGVTFLTQNFYVYIQTHTHMKPTEVSTHTHAITEVPRIFCSV